MKRPQDAYWEKVFPNSQGNSVPDKEKLFDSKHDFVESGLVINLHENSETGIFEAPGEIYKKQKAELERKIVSYQKLCLGIAIPSLFAGFSMLFAPAITYSYMSKHFEKIESFVGAISSLALLYGVTYLGSKFFKNNKARLDELVAQRETLSRNYYNSI